MVRREHRGRAAGGSARCAALLIDNTTLLDSERQLRVSVELIDNAGRIDFRSGDMLDAGLGHFDHVVAMDSLIHYEAHDVVRALEAWAPRVSRSMLITFAPRTPALAAMHAVGRFFPRGDRAPAIEPVGELPLKRALLASQGLQGFRDERCERIASGFYTSQALEIARS